MGTIFAVEDMNSFLREGKPLTFEQPYFPEESFELLSSNIKPLLQSLDRADLHEPLIYILHEMVTNADKANAKRLFFSEKKLNIQSPPDYQKGMERFSMLDEETRKRLTTKLAENHFFTRVSFRLKEQILTLTVINNSIPNEDELLRIHSRITMAKSIKDIAEAYMFLYDESEGAGFGIITTILMLQTLGAHENPYRFVPLRDVGQSMQEITIPLNALSESHIETLSIEISKEIKLIPKLPENVVEIQRMLSNTERPLSDIAAKIAHDPALTAELLKVVNSAQYMLPQKITSIQNAAALVGVNGLKNMMYVYGAQRVMDTRFKELSSLWHHAYRCAFYSAEIARRFGFSEDADDLYVIGILHDIGRIVLLTLHSDLLGKISAHCHANSIPGDFMETLVLGIGHAKTGAEIVRRWNLPEALACPIEYHHQPHLAPDTYRSHAYVVHLADLLATGYDEGVTDFISVKQNVIEFFEIKDRAELSTLSHSLSARLAENEITL